MTATINAMPLPVITLTVRCAISGAIASGGRWANVLHFRKTSGAIDAAALNALESEVVKVYGGAAYAGGAYWLQYAKTTTTVDSIIMTPLDGTSASTFYSPAFGGLQGTDSLPPEVSEVITLRTTSRGRSYRGRIYLPAWVEADSNNGLLFAADITAVLTNYTGFATALGVINWENVVASYLHSTAAKVTSVTMDNKFDSQRRRKS
jgi:hypothetical protein